MSTATSLAGPQLKPQVFISYVREDARYAEALFEYLASIGAAPWMDKRSIIASHDFRTSIATAIREADCFVAIITGNVSAGSGYVHKELRLALDTVAERPPGAAYLICLRVGGCQVPDLQIPELGLSLRHLHWVEIGSDLPWSAESLDAIKTAVMRERSTHSEGQARRSKFGHRSWPLPTPIQQELLSTMQVPEPDFPVEVIGLIRMEGSHRLTEMAAQAHEHYHNLAPAELRSLTARQHWLIAYHLYGCILADDSAACRLRPYIFPIHQYLSEMIRTAKDSDKLRLTAVLRKWLNDRENGYPTSRDFAAFELGMCRLLDAAPDLMDCVHRQDEPMALRRYAALALGMLGAMELIPEIGYVSTQVSDPDFRNLLLHVILHLQSRQGK